MILSSLSLFFCLNSSFVRSKYGYESIRVPKYLFLFFASFYFLYVALTWCNGEALIFQQKCFCMIKRSQNIRCAVWRILKTISLLIKKLKRINNHSDWKRITVFSLANLLDYNLLFFFSYKLATRVVLSMKFHSLHAGSIQLFFKLMNNPVRSQKEIHTCTLCDVGAEIIY